MRNTLALDFGTKTGYCLGNGTATPIAGSWKLSTPEEVTVWRKSRRDRTRDPRILRLHHLLSAQPFSNAELLVFEDVEFSSYTKQNQLWSSFRTVAWLSYPNNVPYECVPVGTLKLFATGHGGATKEMMARALALNTSLPTSLNLTNLDDNAVDAVWIWLWAKKNLSRLT